MGGSGGAAPLAAVPSRLAGKVAFITGAGKGIGQAAAVLFAEEGARLIVADIDDEAAKDTVARVEAAGGQALAVWATWPWRPTWRA